MSFLTLFVSVLSTNCTCTPADWSTIAAFITAITAAILAIAGLIQVKEMRETRKTEYRPHLRVSLHMVEVNVVFLRFVNIGRTAAVDLKFQIQFKKDSETIGESTYKEDAMLPFCDRDLITPESQFSRILNKVTSITISGSYTDGFGGTYNLSQSIDVKDFIDSVNAAKMLMRPKDKVL